MKEELPQQICMICESNREEVKRAKKEASEAEKERAVIA
jgi:hypothetical protein